MSHSLSAETISALMTEDIHIQVIKQTVSTNQDLLDQIRADRITRNTLLAAVEQTGGRGRNGRSWLSSAEGSLTFSLAWRFSQPATQMTGIPLTAGIAVASALQQCGVRVLLKWPNDILKNGGKLAGILTELPDRTHNHWAVIGIGINLLLTDSMEQSIGQPVADMPWLAQMNRSRLMAVIADSLGSHLRQLDEKGFATLAPVWNNLHAYHQKQVAIVQGTETLLSGQALGIDSDGRLRIKTDKGIETVLSGDVSLRTE